MLMTRITNHTSLRPSIDVAVHARDPAIDFLTQRTFTARNHMLRPSLHCGFCGFRVGIFLFCAELQQVRHVSYGIFHTPRCIPEWLVWSQNHKHVGHCRDSESKERSRAVVHPYWLRLCFGPGRLTGAQQRSIVFAMELNLGESASDSVEARGENQNIELMFCSVRGEDSFGGDSLDWCFLQVNQVDIGLVKDLKVPSLKWDSPCTKAMVFRDQALCHHRIVHPLPNLLGVKGTVRLVGFPVGVRVAECTHPLAEPGGGVKLLPKCNALVLWYFHRLPGISTMQKPRGGGIASLPDLVIVFSQLLHLLWRYRLTSQRCSPVCCALEYVNGFDTRLLSRSLNGLNARRTCSNYTDTLSAEITLRVKVAWPSGSMAGEAFEVLDAWYGW